MDHLWSKPGTKWKGFEPCGYTFSETVYDLPVTRINSKTKEKTETTVRTIVNEVAGSKTVHVERRLYVNLTTDTGESSLEGDPFAIDVIFAEATIREVSGKWSPFVLYYFDQDQVTDDPHQMFSFFVVQDNEILNAVVKFSDSQNGKFNPEAFKSLLIDEHPLWFHDGDWREASAAYWYRRFYQETINGQLMVLRPDKPLLFFYPEGRDTLEQNVPIRLASLEIRLARLSRVVWIAAIAAVAVALKLWLR